MGKYLSQNSNKILEKICGKMSVDSSRVGAKNKITNQNLQKDHKKIVWDLVVLLKNWILVWDLSQYFVLVFLIIVLKRFLKLNPF